jgi:2-methylcitrate dehydratase PrpD
MMQTVDFIHSLTWAEVPPDVQHTAARCLLDLCGTLIAGRATELSRIVRGVAAAVYGGDEATLLLDGRRTSAPGAALANGMTIDAMDMHDGYRPSKGHAGVNVFPAALAMGEVAGWRGEDFMAALVIGYEVALRAGVALHQIASDYHTSGAWGALGAAAVTARALGLDSTQTRHALGIAEYHGPRSPMMRCIDHPTMLKDGSGWGSMTGVLAGRLAATGFTGAPALTVEGDDVAAVWADLGRAWLMRDLYFKPYACCRWAQPAVEGALSLAAEHHLAPTDIARIVVHTFEAATHLAVARPANTEQAQYSLPYPVAAALVSGDGRLDPEQMMAPRIFDATVLRLADRVTMAVDGSLEARFPAEALARVAIYGVDGSRFESGICGARGDPDDPLSDAELTDKFNRLASVHLAADRVDALREACWGCAELDDVRRLAALLGPGPVGANVPAGPSPDQ